MLFTIYFDTICVIFEWFNDSFVSILIERFLMLSYIAIKKNWSETKQKDKTKTLAIEIEAKRILNDHIGIRGLCEIRRLALNYP